ncbi:hypothetical protein Poli38472_000815 [Pythium oligandrum]|uniref:AAA+ ATPase domain-containing protein n=1 Tax=Pythium oligandrum TaxID=41045 RepID=A0A8K1CDV2_PYTOL|nr:hypothetical protein Poli38472_000815 [Pythium oligandrum]|eukprot:TMW60773.1 hypothetical protein Poli38472_000815 [Pythium oligandrum]
MVTLVVRNEATAASISASVRICGELRARLRVHRNSYVQITAGSRRSRVFRVNIDEDSIDPGTIVADHWPSIEGDREPFTEAPDVSVRVLSPAFVRVAQYIELTPLDHDPPKLPLPMARVLLKKLILHDDDGVLRFQQDGVEYGEWKYKAYFRGTRRRRRSRENPESSVGIVKDETLVMLLPFTSAGVYALQPQAVQPIGTHGEKMRDLLELSLFPHENSHETTSSAVMHPQSILLHGPSGSGKTTLLQLVAKELAVNVLTLDCTVLATPQYRIENIFTAALRIQPSMILLEDLELIFPRALDETKYKLICRFVACLDHIRRNGGDRVVIVGVVTTIHALNAKIRQVFEEEVALDIPDKMWTVKLFSDLLPRPDLVTDEFKRSVAIKYGQRPSHIVAIARKLWELFNQNATIDQSELESAIEQYGREVATSASNANNLQSSVPNVSWDDIGGLTSVKQKLMEMVVWPLEKPQVFLRMGITPPLGMLLYGPPGTGKTMLAKAAARASGCNFLNVSASDLMKAEFGESEKAITRVFDTARALSPCMVFIDEFQSLFGNRTTTGVTTSRMISQLLIEMDSLKAISDDRVQFSNDSTSLVASDRVFVLAATNALSAIDPAFLQPGRFENVVYVGLPQSDERRAILELQRSKMPWHSDVELDVLVEATEGANAASVVALCQAAAIAAMQRTGEQSQEQVISMQDFTSALATGFFAFTREEEDNAAEEYSEA